jgi:hypothetical protein
MLRDWTDSVSVDGVTAEGERLFTRLIMKADDYGRFHAEPRLVRALCFPLSETIKSDTVRKWLDELHQAGLIFRYEVDEKPVLAIVNFGQRLKQSRAKFPEPDGEDACWLPTSGNFREGDGSSGLKTNRNRKETEREGKALTRPTLPEIVAFCESIGLPTSDGEATSHKWDGNGYTNNGKAIKDWKATIRAWQASKYMPSQKTALNGKPTTPGLTSRPLN